MNDVVYLGHFDVDVTNAFVIEHHAHLVSNLRMSLGGKFEARKRETVHR